MVPHEAVGACLGTLFTLWSKVSLNITLEYDAMDLTNMSRLQISLDSLSQPSTIYCAQEWQ